MKPILSEHFQHREPSGIRLAQIEFMKRGEAVEAVNVAIGNVSLPMHPAMIRRLAALGAPDSPFRDGVVKYTPTVGLEETRAAFLNVIASSGFPVQELHAQITDGGSQAMELILLGVCGPAGSGKRPLLVIDPTYTNYGAMAGRTGRATVSMTRTLGADGRFTLPSVEEIERLIRRHKPGALLVIPYDNPTGQLCSQEQLRELGSLCVKHNLWLVSDEAYRELFYTGGRAVSVWGLNDREVPGIEGRRIGLESTSKVWNACGLRIGALVTDNEEFHRRAVAENTANLCANAIGQYIFGALAHEGRSELAAWYERQREYYRGLLARITGELSRQLPGLIVSTPDAAIYSVLDVREVVKPGFDAQDFVMYCARSGAVEMEGRRYTLLVAPMSGFYGDDRSPNPGRTQMRIAYVEPPEAMQKVPILFRELLVRFEAQRS
ncbi:MAG: aminotransferase class I/II [Spirochaetes bacterium RBG_16_67_19]|nr:MAG: aminotransferase class I/II [Spirochaetes bacterium RBG_16_67_19]